MKKIITVLFLTALLFSCSNHDEAGSNDPLITNIKVDLIRSGHWANPNEMDYYFLYDTQNRLVRKNGGIRGMASSTGFNGFFSTEIYTQLTYDGNRVTVEDFSSSPDFNVFTNTNYYTLNSSNQIVEREIPNPNSVEWYKKQIYIYSNNKLVEIKTSLPNMPYFPDDGDYIKTYSEKFYYDANGNLAKTEYFEQHDGISIGEKIIRTFEDYDTSTNPTKRLYLLNEYFYRSISNNNFRKYTETRYYYNETPSVSEKTWVFNYDSSGNIIVN